MVGYVLVKGLVSPPPQWGVGPIQTQIKPPTDTEFFNWSLSNEKQGFGKFISFSGEKDLKDCLDFWAAETVMSSAIVFLQ